ncbi:unnamed protein product [Cladocopium goreaui]|uniref:ATP-binding cassette sub-family G member 1 n=1 Tax=Cladocopium goreaui TaxID=2562237 RepID=A0A9P1G5J3_9DINO|nr:unnamed protein product [Cladocopium goreaui]
MAGYMDDDWLPPSEDEEEEAAECELPDYGDVNFWTEVYTQQRGRELAPQEWLVSYGHFCAQGWRRFLPPGGRVLDLGCGDAEFMTEAYDDGYHDITGVDIVEPVLETMRQRNVDRPGMTYLWADAMDLSVFEDESFDVVFDKSTLDALKCRGAEATSSMSSEVHRVLRRDGVYLCISLNPPEDAQPAIEGTACGRKWDVEVMVCENENYDGADGPPKHLYMLPHLLLGNILLIAI